MASKPPQTIAIDFDGTCTTHEYPELGKDIGAVDVLKALVANDHKLILYTMRSGDTLDEAVMWFAAKGIPLYGVQTNPKQHTWTASPKCYANLYIDDAALGVPLTFPPNGKRPYVNWVEVAKLLHNLGYI